MDKYIKRINWPWVEVFDNFVPGGETIAINMDEARTPSFNKDKCFRCGLCASKCPVKAIKF